MEEESFSEFELKTTLDVLERIKGFCEKQENGKFTASTLDLSISVVNRILKLPKQN